jgi:glyoxylase I family protein
METTGLDHVILTIGDTARSRAFYADVLGFAVTDFAEEDGEGFSFTAGGTTYYLIPSRAPIAGDRFNESRIGLDHLSFVAPNDKALQDLADRLRAAGADTEGVEVYLSSGNRYVAFRDPDNIQWEYWLP